MYLDTALPKVGSTSSFADIINKYYIHKETLDPMTSQSLNKVKQVSFLLDISEPLIW